MDLDDSEYISIFDIELSKYANNKQDKIIALICDRTKMILETSPNFILINEKDGIHYFWRGTIELIIKPDLDLNDNDFIFMTKNEYEEAKR